MKDSNLTKFIALPQRQKKFAKTKLALLKAFTRELSSKDFSSIVIKDLCLAAEVSEPTFYNYFTSKSHILLYYIQIWSVEMGILAPEFEASQGSNLQLIKGIFTKSYEGMAQKPHLTQAILSDPISFGANADPHKITDAEKWLYFPENKGVETIEAMGLTGLLPPLIKKAVDRGELPKDTDQNLLFLLLSSLFFGTALILIQNNPASMPDLIASELDYLFARIGV